MKATLKFIGHIETPYKTIEECPRNIVENGPLCQLVINKNLRDGLLGLSAGKKIWSFWGQFPYLTFASILCNSLTFLLSSLLQLIRF